MSFLSICGLALWREALRGIGGVLCGVIYSIISLLFQVFVTVAQLNLLSETSVAPIYQRVTIILTIVMTFYITFEFVKYVIQPDDITDKEKGVGNIMVKIVMVIILIAMAPRIFSIAYDLQGKIINQNVISKIVLGTKDVDYTKIGYEFSAEMLYQFYKVDEEECGLAGCVDARTSVNNNLNNLRQTGIANILPGLNKTVETCGLFEATPAIDFNGFIAIIVGGFIIYLLVMYSIDLGTRYGQLLYLQIIAPIAIMGYLLPKKDGIFQKWLKQCFTTYLDVFIRLSLIYFVLLLISVIGSNFDNLFVGIPGVNWGIKSLTYVALVMGLLAFAKRAPKLLQELFPSSGAAGLGFGLGAKERLEPTKNAIKGISGLANTGSRVAGGVGGIIAGAAAGQGFRQRARLAAAGAKEGFSKNNKGLPHRRIRGAQEAATKMKNREENIARNAAGDPNRTPEQNREYAVRQARRHQEHWANIAAEQDRQLKLFDTAKGSMDAINANVDEFKHVKAMKQEWEKAKTDPNKSPDEVKSLEARYKAATQAIREKMASNGGQVTAAMVDGTDVVQFTYEKKDAAGFTIKDPVTGQAITETVTMKFDAGDNAFGGAIKRTAEVEFNKIKAASNEMASIRNATIKIGGVTRTVGEWLSQPNGEEIYAANVNKFKDAMVTPKTNFETSNDFIDAHAFKDGTGESGGSKK